MTDSAETTAAEENGDEAQETASGADEFPSFETTLPPDLAAFLDDDDEGDYTVSEEDLDEMVAENEDVSREVLARLAAAEKKAAHFEKLRVQEAKKNWAEEAKTHFPLAEPFLDEISATSRRGFLRTARQVHDKMAPLVEEKVLKPAREAIEAKKTQATTEGKEAARNAWGQPVANQDDTSEARVTLEQHRERRRPRQLSDTILEMLKSGEKSG